MKTLTRIATLLALLALPALALAAARSPRVYVPNCTRAVFKPKQIVLACGDGSDYLAHLTWTRWTALGATGSGVDEINNCTPDCVSGHFQAYPASIALSRPRRCAKVKHHKVFARIVLHYQAAHPGNSDRMTASLACPLG